MPPATPASSSGAGRFPVFHWAFNKPIGHCYLPTARALCNGMNIQCENFAAVRAFQLMSSDGDVLVLDFSRERPSGTLYSHDHPLLLVAAVRLLSVLNANISTEAGVAFSISTARELLRAIPLPELNLERNAELVGLLRRRYELHELPNSASHSGSVFF